MKNKTYVCLHAAAAVLLLGAFAAPAIWAQAANGQQAARHNAVSGQYKVVDTTDAGQNEVRVTLLIRLTNHSEEDFSISGLELLGPPHRPQSAAVQAAASISLALAPHASATTKQQFTISSSEYQAWRKGLRPHLAITAQAGGATAASYTVELAQAEGIREQ